MSLNSRSSKIHFVGVGGIGMSGLAELLCRLGHKVSGSDLTYGESVHRLEKLGLNFFKGHSEKFIEQCSPDVLVYSSAVKKENPELLYARKNNIPIVQRAEMLGEIMRLKRGIALAGSHGKTTTTGFTSQLLRAAGLDPTVVIGGRFDAIGSNAAWGSGEWLVAEADESDGSFLRLTPEIAVVTNIDREHIYYYGSFEAVKQSFLDFMDRIPFYGRLILCSDCPNLFSLRDLINKPVFWYGADEKKSPDFLIQDIKLGPKPQFKIYNSRTHEVEIESILEVPGLHNILNATASYLVAREVGISNQKISQDIRAFKGVRRRFEYMGKWNNSILIQDYAHHPTEIAATIAAAKDVFNFKPVVLFQPHRYSRTRDSWADFAKCFKGASKVFTLPIYPASEIAEVWTREYDRENFSKNIEGVDSSFCESFEDLIQKLRAFLKTNNQNSNSVLLLGAGDMAQKIMDSLNSEIQPHENI